MPHLTRTTLTNPPAAPVTVVMAWAAAAAVAVQVSSETLHLHSKSTIQPIQPMDPELPR